MTPFQIAVLPGDGIGPEVIAANLEFPRAVAARLEGVRFDHTIRSGGFRRARRVLFRPRSHS